MNKQAIITGVAALFLGVGVAEAAPIDLGGLGFQEGAPSYSGSGGVYYAYDVQLLSEDFLNPIVLDDFAGSEVLFLYDPFGPNTVDVFYEPGVGDVELFTITQSGATETGPGDKLEFLLKRDFVDLANGTAGVGANAMLRISSPEFDFSILSPFDFFDDNSTDTGFGFLEYFTDVTVTLTALERSTTVVPLPASLPLVIAGLGAFAMIRRRQRISPVC